MADLIKLEFDNIQGFAEAKKLAPKKIMASLKREMDREGKKFANKYRRAFLFGLPGINLPKRLATFTKKGKKKFNKRKARDAKAAQAAHVKTKVVSGQRGVVLVGYLSRFLEFHSNKLEAAFYSMFTGILPQMRSRLEREAARIVDSVLSKGLRDSRRR